MALFPDRQFFSAILSLLRNMHSWVKKIALSIPGVRLLGRRLEKGTTKFMLRMPVVGQWMWKRRLAGSMAQPERLISTIQQTAHAFDHFWVRGMPVPVTLLKQMEVLLKAIREHGIPLDDPLLWVLQMYAIERTGLQDNYIKPIEGGLNIQDGIPAHCTDVEEIHLVECIKGRRSVRLWNDKEIACEEIQKLIDIAKWAPSSCNRQPWKVMMLTTNKDKQFLTQYYKASHNRFWTSAPMLLVVLANLGFYSDSKISYVQLDSGAFIQNLLLLLHAHGLAACWVGFTAWDNYGNCQVNQSERDEFYTRFGIPSDYLPTSLIPVGYSNTLPRPPVRKDVNNIIITRAKLPNADFSTMDRSEP